MTPAFGAGLVLCFGLALNLFFADPDPEFLKYVQLDTERGVDRAYRGRFERTHEFRTLLEGMDTRRKRALDEAQRRTGLACFAPDRLIVRFKDSMDDHGFGASNRLVRSDQGEVNLVTLSVEQAVVGVMDLDASLVHEFIHCIMRQRMGDRPYRALPLWIREGAAVWGAGQIDERARDVVAGAFMEHRSPREVLAALEGDAQRVDQYLTAALAFEYLAHNHGKGAVRYLLNEIVDGTSPGRAFELATGVPLAELEEGRRVFARMYFAALIERSGLLEFQEAQKLRAEGDTPGAIERLLALAVTWPDSLLHANAWYWIGIWSYEERRYPQAALAFTIVVRHFPGHVGLQEDSRERLQSCYHRMNGEDITLVQAVLAPSGRR